jgi:hypothetical protein
MKVQRITSAAIHNRCAHAGLRPSSLRAGWRLAMDSLIAIVVGGLTYDDGNGMTSACSQTAFLAWAWELGQSVSSPGFFPGLSHPQPLLFKQLALLQGHPFKELNRGGSTHGTATNRNQCAHQTHAEGNFTQNSRHY